MDNMKRQEEMQQYWDDSLRLRGLKVDRPTIVDIGPNLYVLTPSGSIWKLNAIKVE